MQREHIVKDGVYIPATGIDYPSNPGERILQSQKIRDITVDEKYPYLMKSCKEKFFHYLVYLGIFTFVFPLQWIRYGLKIKGKKNLRKNKKLLKNGAITVANHVYRWDFLAVVQAASSIGRRRLWFPTFADYLNTKDALVMRSAGGIPMPEQGMGAMRRFNEAFDILVSKKKWLHVFPEHSRWNWYEPIRPFKLGAFTLAYRYDLPIIPMAISYRELTGWRKLFFKEPLITIEIGELIFPNKDEKRKVDSERMCREAHKQICEMAGIVQNGWDAVSDD